MMACLEVVNLICIKLDDFEDQRIEFQFKCMDFLFKKNKVSHWKIDQETFCVFFLCHLRKLQNSIACIQNCVRFSIYRQETTMYRFLKCTITVLPLSQNALIFWFFSRQLLVERLFIIVEFQYDCKLNDAKLNKVKYTKDQLTCYLSKYIE